MSEFMNQNDDDLFSYDPSKEEKPSAPFVASSSNSKISNEIYDQITKNIEENDDENFLKINGLRIKFAQAILNSYHFWVSPISALSYLNTVTTVLDQLTNGRFSDLYLYNYLENNIIRRNHIIFLLTETFDPNNVKDSQSFDQFLEKMGIKLNDSYVPTYVGTLVRISSHILSKERAMYISLADKLKVVPNPAVLDPHPSTEEVFDATQASVASSQAAMISASFDRNIDASFVEKLNNLNTTEIEYQVKKL